VDFGVVVAAERLGLPYASVQSTASGSVAPSGVVAEKANQLRVEHGLPPDPSLKICAGTWSWCPSHPAFAILAFRCHPRPTSCATSRPIFGSGVPRMNRTFRENAGALVMLTATPAVSAPGGALNSLQ
jgi:hypothetical protein